MFFKIGVLKNFASFAGKHLSWSLFLIYQVKVRQGLINDTCNNFELNLCQTDFGDNKLFYLILPNIKDPIISWYGRFYIFL